jgi:hypothetical protein
MSAARGAVVQKKARQVVRGEEMKAAARKGPRMLPKPTHDPMMPWYLPRRSRVVMSDTMIMARLLTPPPPIPARARNT